MSMTRDEMEARSELFNRFALQDQKSYYDKAIKKHRKAAMQVNRIRAWLAFGTGVAAALAGLLVYAYSSGGACAANGDNPAFYCGALDSFLGLLSVLAVILPALGGAFSTLADLYQWDKLIDIYRTALDNMERADALSPINGIPNKTTYRASMRAFAEGTLRVMSDETSQWGQSIRTPRQLEEFVQEEKDRIQNKIDNLNKDHFQDRLKPDDGE